MLTKLDQTFSLLIVLVLFNLAANASMGQGLDSAQRTQPSSVTVTAATSGEAVRFSAPGNTTHIRVEVFASAGERVFDSGNRDGNIFDWRWHDEQAAAFSADNYLCVVTVQSLSGRTSRKLAYVSFANKQATLKPIEVTQLNPAQLQALGSLEADTPLTIIGAEQPIAATVIAHDGNDGQITRTRGALTFRVGDLFSGIDKEQMRLTAEGNLGLGTSKPKARLDVAGTIRAREGFMFSDGSTLKVNDKGVLTRTSADGTAPDSVSSTQNQIAKFTDNAGTLGDSSLTDAAGNIGLGVASPGDLLDIAGAPNIAGRSGLHVRTTTTTGNATLYFDNDRGNFSAYGGLLTGGSANPFLFFGVTRADKTFLIADGPDSLGLGIGTLVSKPVIFGTANAERMRIDSDGNVGINTLVPSERLHVAGNGLFNGNLTVNGTLNATLPTGSGSYIQNTTSPAQVANFNISGNGSVGGTLTASTISGNGAGLTSLNAGNISTGTLAIGRGGTGLSLSGAAGNFLRSDGTNWTSAALLPADIPSGSGSYIQNNPASQQAGNFNISGSGEVGGDLTVGQRLFARSLDYSLFMDGPLSIGASHATDVQIGRSNIPIHIIGGLVDISAETETRTNTLSATNVFAGNFDNPNGNLSIAGSLATTVSIGKPTTVSGLLTANSGISTNTETISGDLTVGGTINGTVSNANNAANLGGVAASQYVQTTDSRMSDARSPLSGSDNYIQNTTNEQSANFNMFGNATIRGSSTGAALNLTGTQPPPTPFGIGAAAALRVVGAKGGNATANAQGGAGATVLIQAGDGGDSVTFGGRGGSITLQPGAPGNGFANDSGSVALAPNGGNVGIGITATSKHLHVFGPGDQEIGIQSSDAGGRLWTLQSSNGGANGLFQIIDRIANKSRFSILDSGKVGIGTTAPEQSLHVDGLGVLSTGSGAGFVFRDRGSISANDDWLWYSTGNVARFRRANDPNPGDLFTISATGVVQLFGLGTAGGVALCFNPGNQISLCSSSIRYKNNIHNFSPGLDLIRRLRPVSFNWKANNQADMGLVAEDVAAIAPLLVTHNDKGEIEGVKYDRVGVVLINAVKEQQAQIENQQTLIQSQQKLLETQQQQIDALKKLICATNASAEVCKAKE